MAGDDKKIPAPEAARRAGMSRERLLRQVQNGEIAAEVVAGRYLISESSLERFLHHREVTATR